MRLHYLQRWRAGRPDDEIAKAVKPIEDKFNDEVKKNDTFVAEIAELRKQLQAHTPSTQSGDLGTLAAMSNSELRSAASQFVNELRKFQARFDTKKGQLQNQELANAATVPYDSPKAREEIWAKGTAAEMELQNQHNSEYDVTYRQQVLWYKIEICKRVEFLSPCPTNDIAAHMIDEAAGMAWPKMVADYLTKIIDTLPSDR